MGTTPDWQPLQRSRTYELVLDQVEEQILAGKLGVGDRLPPERAHGGDARGQPGRRPGGAAGDGSQGVLRRPKVGTGPESGSVIAGLPSLGLSRLLRLHVALANFPLADVVEARVHPGTASARLAAAHATSDQLARMRACMERMADQAVTREEFNDVDTEFHVVLAEAAGNKLVADMTIAMRNAMRPHPATNVQRWSRTGRPPEPGCRRAPGRLRRPWPPGTPRPPPTGREAHPRRLPLTSAGPQKSCQGCVSLGGMSATWTQNARVSHTSVKIPFNWQKMYAPAYKSCMIDGGSGRPTRFRCYGMKDVPRQRAAGKPAAGGRSKRSHSAPKDRLLCGH